MSKLKPVCEDNLILVITRLDYLREMDEDINHLLPFPYHIYIQVVFSINEVKDLALPQPSGQRMIIAHPH